MPTPDGKRSKSLSDALIRRQHNIERAKAGKGQEYTSITSAVLIVLAQEVAKLPVSDFGLISKARLAKVVKRVLSEYDKVSQAHQQELTLWLQEFIALDAAFTTTAINRAVKPEEEKERPSDSNLWTFFTSLIIGATGYSFHETMTSFRRQQRGAIKKYIQRAFTQNWSTTQLVSGFKGTARRKFKDGLAARLRRSANTIVDTIIQAGAAAARSRVFGVFGDILIGYTWVSILDGKTSKICRSLSGRFFEPGGPVPPIHYNCRSHIEPIFRSNALRRAGDNLVTAGETYYEWLSRQPKSFQDEVLGSSWAKIFRDKGLSPEQFADKSLNRRFQPITLSDLKQRDPKLFD